MQIRKKVEVGYGSVNKVYIGLDNSLVFIGGPCAIESKDHSFVMAEKLVDLSKVRNSMDFQILL